MEIGERSVSERGKERKEKGDFEKGNIQIIQLKGNPTDHPLPRTGALGWRKRNHFPKTTTSSYCLRNHYVGISVHITFGPFPLHLISLPSTKVLVLVLVLV